MNILVGFGQTTNNDPSIQKTDQYQPHDSVFNNRNIILECTPLTYPQYIQVGPPLNQGSITYAYQAKLGLGFFATRRINVGLHFYPNVDLSNRGLEKFSWKMGPYFKYYIVFKRHKKEIKWFSLVPMAQYNFGTTGISPLSNDSVLSYKIYHTVSMGLGINFRIINQLSLLVDFDASYRFNATGTYQNGWAGFLGIGINYIFKVQSRRKK